MNNSIGHWTKKSEYQLKEIEKATEFQFPNQSWTYCLKIIISNVKIQIPKNNSSKNGFRLCNWIENELSSTSK